MYDWNQSWNDKIFGTIIHPIVCTTTNMMENMDPDGALDLSGCSLGSPTCEEYANIDFRQMIDQAASQLPDLSKIIILLPPTSPSQVHLQIQVHSPVQLNLHLRRIQLHTTVSLWKIYCHHHPSNGFLYNTQIYTTNMYG